jgi:hypothetical protein
MQFDDSFRLNDQQRRNASLAKIWPKRSKTDDPENAGKAVLHWVGIQQ